MLGVVIALETVKPQWRDPEFGHRLVRLREISRENPSQRLVLVLGTSRTQNAIQPAAMGFSADVDSPRVFNFGQSGSSPLKVMLTLPRLLDEGIRPAAILVEVLPMWLSMAGVAEEQFRDKVPQLSRDDLRYLTPYCNNASDLQDRWLAARLAALYTQRTSLMSHWLPHWLPWQHRISFQWQTMDSNGFVPFLYTDPPPAFRTEATAQTRQQYSGSFGGFHPSGVSIRALQELVSRCRAEEIPIAFFSPPVAPTFREWFAEEVWLAGKRDLHGISREMGVDVFPAPDFFSDADFADGQHMLRPSAERYSRWLAENHIRAWLERNRLSARCNTH